MATETETLWAVYTNTDLTEGRGREYAKVFCLLKSTALRLAKKGYVQGTDCPVKPVQVLILDGQRVLPASVILAQEPSREDEIAEKRLEETAAVVAKAKSLGLTDDDLATLARQSKEP